MRDEVYAHVDLSVPCVIWQKAIDKTGYGRQKFQGRLWMAHRVAYLEFHGHIDPDLVVAHLCHNRGCVEPRHLMQMPVEVSSARHKSDCPCSACHPGEYQSARCEHGHDISTPSGRTNPRSDRTTGRCLKCQRTANQEHMRKVRAGGK